MSTLRDTPELLPFEREIPRPITEADRTRPIWEVILEIAASHPDEELDKIPHDAALNHDHYLYGTSKRASE